MMVAVTFRPLDAAGDALIALQGQLIAMLAAQNAALAERVAELEDRLARLERAASRNSGNSSLPPSLDDQAGRIPPGKPQRGGRGKRNPGKQPGSPDRTWPGARTPAGRCRITRRGRARAARTWPARRTWGWPPRIRRSRSRR